MHNKSILEVGALYLFSLSLFHLYSHSLSQGFMRGFNSFLIPWGKESGEKHRGRPKISMENNEENSTKYPHIERGRERLKSHSVPYFLPTLRPPFCLFTFSLFECPKIIIYHKNLTSILHPNTPAHFVYQLFHFLNV